MVYCCNFRWSRPRHFTMLHVLSHLGLKDFPNWGLTETCTRFRIRTRDSPNSWSRKGRSASHKKMENVCSEYEIIIASGTAAEKVVYRWVTQARVPLIGTQFRERIPAMEPFQDWIIALPSHNMRYSIESLQIVLICCPFSLNRSNRHWFWEMSIVRFEMITISMVLRGNVDLPRAEPCMGENSLF
jgi:hypothetical protein